MPLWKRASTAAQHSQQNMDRTSILNLFISGVLVAQGVIFLPTLQHKTLNEYAARITDLLHRQTHTQTAPEPFRFSF